MHLCCEGMLELEGQVGASEVRSQAFICVSECGSARPRIKTVMKAVQLVAETLIIHLGTILYRLGNQIIALNAGANFATPRYDPRLTEPLAGPANNN